VDKRIAVLSGGEKARVALAKMLVRPAALLAMDEPTNHLDLASREVVEAALAAFAGTIVFISHDRYFINRVATRVVEVAQGVLTSYPGSYDDYLGRAGREATTETAPRRPLGAPRPRGGPDVSERARAAGLPALTGDAAPGAGAVPRAERGGPRRARPGTEVRVLRRRLEEVERQIQAVEARLRELEASLGDPLLYTDGARARAASTERRSAEEQVAWLMREWEELSTALAAHE
jgi:ATP-binding cassette subfamily F protein 3